MVEMAAAKTKSRLSTCWEQDIQWDLFPKKVKEVQINLPEVLIFGSSIRSISLLSGNTYCLVCMISE